MSEGTDKNTVMFGQVSSIIIALLSLQCLREDTLCEPV
jgi:hypothetical protein